MVSSHIDFYKVGLSTPRSTPNQMEDQTTPNNEGQGRAFTMHEVHWAMVISLRLALV